MRAFKEYCTLRFGPSLRNNPLGELVNLNQTGTVEYYQREFQGLLARAYTTQVDQHVDLFTEGLLDSIRLDVEMQNPPNLVQAMKGNKHAKRALANHRLEYERHQHGCNCFFFCF